MTLTGVSIICNCDDERAFHCEIHGYEKHTLDDKPRKFKSPPVHETVAIDDLNNGIVGERRVKLLANMTHAEDRLWSVLNEMGIDALYQAVIFPYYADFLLWEYGAIIEADGSSHDNKDAKDDRRSEYIEALGIKVFRIDNKDVCKEAVDKILTNCRMIPKHDVKAIIDNHNKKYYK